IKATPEQVRAEVWMSLIHGSRGLIYFVHQFKPKFEEAALLNDPAMLASITQINRRIQRLAPALNGPSVLEGVTVKSTDNLPVAWMLKRRGTTLYWFTVNMSNRPTRCSFAINDSSLSSPASATVLDEGRTISIPGHELIDDFKPYEVHLYEMGTK
ncbi:MAG TPA: hypothetical protein PLX89_25565, partial [Verrucomicrobiota bacterium]|nr:hypothetical protein [Verrucomicrobiota bacterium]